METWDDKSIHPGRLGFSFTPITNGEIIFKVYSKDYPEVSDTFTYIIYPNVNIKKKEDLIMYDSIIDIKKYDTVSFYLQKETNNNNSDFEVEIYNRFGSLIAQDCIHIDNNSLGKYAIQLPIDKKRIKSGIYYLIVSQDNHNRDYQPLKFVKKFIIKK